jgi:hypothetical protein
MKRRDIILGLMGIAFAALALLAPSAAIAHGPGGHGEAEFTAFAAAQKAMTVFDQLISGGKLDPSWETQFSVIQVSRRVTEGRNEFMVKLSRDQGDPASLYVFFDEQGKYSGSNFSGE